MAGGLDVQNFAAMDGDLGGFRRLAGAFASDECEPADTGDAGERFAAETHRGNGGEVFGPVNLAGGMAFETEQGIVLAHADAVVSHADEAASAGLDLDRDPARLRVQGVFDQFLDHAGGPLDHFAGSDLVGDLFGEEPDAVHAGKLSTSFPKYNRVCGEGLKPGVRLRCAEEG